MLIVLELRLTKYQQIHPNTTPAAQQMFTFLFTFVIEALLYVGAHNNGCVCIITERVTVGAHTVLAKTHILRNNETCRCV